jgi:hypothetical protein
MVGPGTRTAEQGMPLALAPPNCDRTAPPREWGTESVAPSYWPSDAHTMVKRAKSLFGMAAVLLTLLETINERPTPTLLKDVSATYRFFNAMLVVLLWVRCRSNA